MIMTYIDDEDLETAERALLRWLECNDGCHQLLKNIVWQAREANRLRGT